MIKKELSDKAKYQTVPDKEKLEAPLRRKAEAKLAELQKKLIEAEEKYKERLKNFRGVPHESASGELAFSELKVREDFVASLNAEIKALEEKMGVEK